MGARLEGALEARRILERRGRLPEELLDRQVSASWQRCLAAGMDPRTGPRIRVLDGIDLRDRGAAVDEVARLARVEMETLYDQIAGSNYMIAFGDPEGVVIDTIADPAFAASPAGRELRAGSVWGEGVAGTNAMGTSLGTQQGLIVHGPEHFFQCFAGITCAAAPIVRFDGRLAGVLDASSFSDAYPAHTLVLVRMAAMNITNSLFQRDMRQHYILELHSRPEFLGSIAAGLLALDGDGQVRGINAQLPLLMPGVQLRLGMNFDAAFQEPFEAVLARLQRAATTIVRDPLDRAYTLALRAAGRAPGRQPSTPFGIAVRAAEAAPPAPAPGLPEVEAGPAPARRKAELPALDAKPATGRDGLRDGHDLVCNDRRLRDCLALVEAAVKLPTPILITGETGTGKEMLARHAHRISGRRGELVAVNCAAMPAELFEAELFGYSSGAFTGARREGHGGLIVEADGGTLLLDEIADLPLPLQAALLRFLDDFQVRPVGGRGTRTVDTLVIAATNADLRQAVAERRFRADLLYRLNTVHVVLPALRERSDLDALALAVLARIDARARLTPDALAALAAHDWPGNIRELRAVLTRARLQAGDAVIEARHLGALAAVAAEAESAAAPARPGSLRTLSGDLVRRTLAELQGNVSATASRLSISRTTVYRYLREPSHV